MLGTKSLLLRLPRRFRRPLTLLSVAVLFVLVVLLLWHSYPATQDRLLAWGGLVFGIAILAAELVYSVLLGKDDKEILPNFHRIFNRTIEIIKWCARDENGELMITSATPIFGLELEGRQREEIKGLLKSRIVNEMPTRLICLEPREISDNGLAPLDKFCLALSQSKYTQLPADVLQKRAREDLIEFGRLVLNHKKIELRLGAEPPHSVILAKNSKGERKGLLYLAATSTLEGNVDVKGLEVDSPEFGEALEELFEFMWRSFEKADYGSFDERSRKHVARDLKLIKFHEKQTAISRDTEVAGIELSVHRDVFPPDLGLGIPLVLKSIDVLAKTEFRDMPRDGLVGVDVGTGSGILAMKLAEYCGVVYATDSLEPAVQNANSNLQNLKSKRDDFEFEVHQGDLLEPVFDKLKTAGSIIIVFNHPLYPSPLGLYGTLVPDGGTAIIDRFLSQVSELFKYIDGIVLMPYSPIAAEHNPLTIASRHGLSATVDENHAASEDDVCILRLMTPLAGAVERRP